MQAFLNHLKEINNDDELLDFCRRKNLHGTPKLFEGREDDHYEFRKKISQKFNINFHEIYITGSAKLGFSAHKRKLFDFDSDIDIAIISSDLYERFMSDIYSYQMELRENRRAISSRELKQYHTFLEYTAIGWMRPDQLPTSFHIGQIKQEWFDFFHSLSYGKSEVGDYKVTAGAFKSYSHLEKYAISSLNAVRKSLEMENFIL